MTNNYTKEKLVSEWLNKWKRAVKVMNKAVLKDKHLYNEKTAV